MRALRHADLALLCACLLLTGCGRIGFELWPMDAGQYEEEETGPGEEQDAGDAGEMDAGEDAASEGGAPYVDGCVPDPNGGCTTCDSDAYVEDKSCGTGCFDTPSRCLKGVEYPCLRGRPLSSDDSTCDGVDDNCDGTKDEDYRIENSTCGIGVCTAAGHLECDRGEVKNTCSAGAQTSVRDDAMGSGNGLDDDCDGSIDEDVSSCTNTAPRAYDLGTHNIAIPTGCGTVTIQLWGGGGAAGERAGISEVRPGGKGGSGGYVRSMLTVTGPITIHVGGGASASCPPELGAFSAGGINTGAPTYAGGAGSGSPRSRAGAGLDGLDGLVTMGGRGASNLLGSSGGNGFYGGGGGGDGWADFVNGLLPEHGGGGGAASVAFMNGVRVLVAGGGGGGGAAATLVYAFGDTGGKGGEGCSGNGTSGNNARVGGGGGGGVCTGTGMGMVRSMGTNGEPANGISLPRTVARGSADCENPGGSGYAIVTFAR